MPRKADPLKGTAFWRPPEEERAALLRHLLAELPPGHVLFTNRDSLSVEARDLKGDRLAVIGSDPPAAIVRMSWSGRPPMAPFLPETETFASLDALIAAAKEAK